MTRYDNMRYVVCHSHPESLVLSQQMREEIMSSGKVIDIYECSTYSLKQEYLSDITRRPLIVVLWGMEDRYGVAKKLGIEVFVARDFVQVMSLTDDYRLLGSQGSDHNQFWGDPNNPEHVERARQWFADNDGTAAPVGAVREHGIEIERGE